MMRRVFQAVFILGMLNFVLFFLVSSYLGGDAANGRVEAGRYFVGSHGRLTEVTADAFLFSLWHARSLFVTHPLAILAAALAFRARKAGSGAG